MIISFNVIFFQTLVTGSDKSGWYVMADELAVLYPVVQVTLSPLSLIKR